MTFLFTVRCHYVALACLELASGCWDNGCMHRAWRQRCEWVLPHSTGQPASWLQSQQPHSPAVTSPPHTPAKLLPIIFPPLTFIAPSQHNLAGKLSEPQHARVVANSFVCPNPFSLTSSCILNVSPQSLQQSMVPLPLTCNHKEVGLFVFICMLSDTTYKPSTKCSSAGLLDSRAGATCPIALLLCAPGVCCLRWQLR